MEFKFSQKELPSADYHCIEYPGFGQTDNMIKTLGSLSRIQNAFNSTPSKADSATAGTLELRYDPEECFLRPIDGEIIPTANLLLKVTKRTNKVTGESTLHYSIAGSVSKTCRFRAMADFMYIPHNSSVAQLRRRMAELDFEFCKQFEFDAETKGLENDLKQLPPPLFCRHDWSLDYDFKENKARNSNYLQVVENGVVIEVKKPRRSFKYQIMDNSSDNVPSGPISYINGVNGVEKNMDDEAEMEVEENPTPFKKITMNIFQQRPIWTLQAFSNVFEATCVTEKLQMPKKIDFTALLIEIAYKSQSGPWRGTWIRFGYDPRKDRAARMYQVVEVRATKSYSRTKPLTKDLQSHLFTSDTVCPASTLQIVDIVDASLVGDFQSVEFCRKNYDEKEGWYVDGHMDFLREELRRKVTPLNTDADDDEPDSRRARLTGMRHKKRNKALKNESSENDIASEEEKGIAATRSRRSNVSYQVEAKVNELMKQLKQEDDYGIRETFDDSDEDPDFFNVLESD